MKIVIIGGRLQGVEAVYLAHQAGWEAVVLDKTADVPASGLADCFWQFDVLECSDRLEDVVKNADLVLPALEQEPVLRHLSSVCEQAGVPLALDLDSYRITSSKLKSDRLFAELGIPAPANWPDCRFPVIAKPSDSSGSRGVCRLEDQAAMARFREGEGSSGEWVIQEYLEGGSYSLEVLGCRGKYVTLQTTDIIVDRDYDCMRVLAPAALNPELEPQLHSVTKRIAGALGLTGIMDVEVIDHQGVLKVLEIDARLPSQTPTAVYHSIGVNMLVMLYDIFARGQLELQPDLEVRRAVVYEHVLACEGQLVTLGEHIVTTAGPLRQVTEFFGADEALTDYRPGRERWVATLIITGNNHEEAWQRRCRVIEEICQACCLTYRKDKP